MRFESLKFRNGKGKATGGPGGKPHKSHNEGEKKIMSQYLRYGSSAHAELDVRGSFIMECAGISPHTPASADRMLFNKVS